MKLVLSVVWFASVSSLAAVLGQSGGSHGSSCLNVCYNQQGRPYCCSSASSYRRPLASGSSSFQQPITSSLGSTQQTYQPLTTGSFPQNTVSTAGSTQGSYQPLTTGVFSQSTGLTAGSYRQPSAITTDAYHQQVLSPGTYNEPTVINSGSGVIATSPQDYTSVTIGSRLQPSTNTNFGTLQQNNSLAIPSQTSLLSTSSIHGSQSSSTINTGHPRQTTTTITTGNAIQQPLSYQQPTVISSDLSTVVNEESYVQSLDGGVQTFQPHNVQTTDYFRRPLGSSLGNSQSVSQVSGTFQQPTNQNTDNFGRPIGSTLGSIQQVSTWGNEDNYGQSLAGGISSLQQTNVQATDSFGRPITSTHGSYHGSNRFQQSTNQNTDSFVRPIGSTLGSNQQVSTWGNEDNYGQSLAGGISSLQQPNVQATDSFGRPITSTHGSYQQSQGLPAAGTTTLGGGTFQRPTNFRQPLTSQRNYNQQLSTGTASYQRPVSNVRGSYGTGAYQRPLGLSVGSYQRTDNRYVN